MNKYLFIFLFLVSSLSFSQELLGKVTVDYSKISPSNVQIYKTLETSLTDFVNKTAFSEKPYKANEKINCNFYITINSVEGNNFEASIQVQSSRPVFNSSYSSPVLNINDKDFNFQYTEFENFVYNPNSYDSNLMSVMSFYSQIIIAIDSETFMQTSGDKNFEIAQNIVSLSATGGSKGWSQTEKTQNRYYLITDLLSESFKPYKDGMFTYHFKALDGMEKNSKEAKKQIADAVSIIAKIYNVRPSAYLMRIFIDAKADEIVSIFSGGPSIPIDNLIADLNKISPTNSAKWSQIKL